MYKMTIAAITALLFAGAAIALDYPDEGPGVEPDIPSFEELDRDGNGYISRSEAAALPCLQENFDEVNPRSDEGLDRAEYQQAVARHC